MRPLAKAVTKTLERVRSHLREQVLDNGYWILVLDRVLDTLDNVNWILVLDTGYWNT